MKKGKLLLSIMLAGILILTQVAVVFAAPPAADATPISGVVEAITLETDPHTGVTTVLVSLRDETGEIQTVRISLEIASSPEVGLVTLDDDGNPVIVSPLPEFVEIDPATVIPDEEVAQHPVGSALATFFADISGLDYDAIMEAHANGTGFGVIAQVLWLTRKLDGDTTIFEAILQAKQDKDFSDFMFEDGTSPTNWAQFRKAVMGDDKKGSLGLVMSQNSNDGNNGNGSNPGHGNGNSNKDKDKTNNGNGNGHGNGNGNGNRP